MSQKYQRNGSRTLWNAVSDFYWNMLRGRLDKNIDNIEILIVIRTARSHNVSIFPVTIIADIVPCFFYNKTTVHQIYKTEHFGFLCARQPILTRFSLVSHL